MCNYKKLSTLMEVLTCADMRLSFPINHASSSPSLDWFSFSAADDDGGDLVLLVKWKECRQSSN